MTEEEPSRARTARNEFLARLAVLSGLAYNSAAPPAITPQLRAGRKLCSSLIEGGDDVGSSDAV